MPRRRVTWRRLRRWLRSGPTADPAEMLGLDVETREELAWHAHRLFEAGEPAQAERVYRLMSTLWPGHASSQWLGIGACRQALGDLELAEEAYRNCLESEPTNVHALVNRAEVRLLGGRVDQAVADLAAARAKLERGDAGEGLRDRFERLTQLAAGRAKNQD